MKFLSFCATLVICLLSAISIAASSTATTKVFQSSEAIQCESNGVPLEGLRTILTTKGVTVLSAACGHDGYRRIAACGAPAGYIGIFEIETGDLSNAQQLGFRLLSELARPSVQPCPKPNPAVEKER
jgi:hypothetical protein